jgi:pyridoxal phosphate enzyme (YggS family)
MSSIQDRYNAVLTEVESIASGCGRPPPTLVVVSKNRTPDEIREAYQAGARHFGENRAQGFQEHRDALADLADIQWHFIGHLQTNKVSKVVGCASLVHSVDSIRLLECLDNRARRTKAAPVPVLLQVNVSGEQQKHGFEPAALDAALRFAERLEHVSIQGLMTMGPLDASEETQDEVFEKLRSCHEALLTSSEGRYQGDQLSMGMSQDFRSAIRHGATMVRIGSAIFQSQGGT